MPARCSHNGRRLGQCPQRLACDHDQSKILAYYASVFAALVPAHAPIWVYAAAMGVTSLISCTWYCGVAWLLSGEAARRTFLKARPAMETVIGLFLVGLAIRMFVTR